MKFDYHEGATPIDDISGLIPKWVKTQEDLNLVEAENVSYATNKYLSEQIRLPQKWFTVSYLQKIHRDMLGEVWDWAGSFRTTSTIPGVSPYRIRIDLESFCAEVLYWSTDAVELTLLEQAARIHHQLVFIHPFKNGNGRFSRIVADRFLKAWKLPCPQWPTDLGGDGQHQKSYINAIKSGDKGDFEPLINFMKMHGAKDPALSELLGLNFFQQFFKNKKLEFVVKAHIRRGDNVNDVENNGHCPLNIAINSGRKNIARLLLKNGAKYREHDRSGLNAFQWALIREMYDLAYEMYKQGYPYTPRHPNTHLKIPQQNLYKFDLNYF